MCCRPSEVYLQVDRVFYLDRYLIIDLVFREGGGKGLERRIPKKQFGYVKCKIEKRPGWALLLASLMPPPFPFTPFVAGAAAFEYPRKRLLGIIAAARLTGRWPSTSGGESFRWRNPRPSNGRSS